MPIESSNACKACLSSRHSSFNAEVAIHFPGLQNLNKPVVLAFPKLAVCLECGFTEFTIPETELLVLSDGSVREGALVFDLEAGGRGKDRSCESATNEAPPLKNGVHGGK